MYNYYLYVVSDIEIKFFKKFLSLLHKGTEKSLLLFTVFKIYEHWVTI